ncbi:hypothetical protein ONZ45_g19602 [Pleurotus djamor]|nr:hypothetical protein ONZ45_g19602 [Pleurotus djamor]
MSSSDPRQPWLMLTAVSQNWRQTILSTPAFWADILVTSPELTAIMIERSKSLHLRIRFDFDCFPIQFFKDPHPLSAAVSERFEEIHICFGKGARPTTGLTPIQFVSTFPVPNLKRLILEGVGSLPSSLWLHSPLLCYLKLARVRFSPLPAMPAMPALRHIELDFSGAQGCTLSGALLFLKKAPNVETFRVSPLYEYINPRWNEILCLNRLQQLGIGLLSPAGAKFFDYLTVPDSSRIFIRCRPGGIRSNSNALIRLVRNCSRLSGIHRASVSFLTNNIFELDLYLKGERTSFFRLEYSFRSWNDGLLSLSTLVKIPEVEVSFVDCAEWFRGYLYNINPDLDIHFMKVKQIGFSYCCYCWEYNRNVLRNFMRIHSPHVKRLHLSQCKMSEALLHELEQYAQVTVDLTVDFVTDRPNEKDTCIQGSSLDDYDVIPDIAI